MLDLGTSFLASVARDPDAIAIVDGPVRLTYSAWFRQVSAVVDGLRQLGLRKGDHLVSLLQNRLDAATLHWACQFAEIIITPLNWRATADEVEYCLNDAEARAVVYEDVSAASVTASPRAGSLPCLDIGSQGFVELRGTNAPDALPQAAASDWSLMLYTSGTTSRPKGVPRRHQAERAAAVAHVAQNLYRRGEATLGVMPLYHTMGVRSLLAMSLIGGKFVCLPRFDAKQALDLIAAEHVSNLYLVPTLYHDLVHHPDFAATDTSSVRKLGFAGASMTDGLLQKLQDAFTPDLFVNHYGSSEVYTVAINQDAVRKPGCAGRAGLNQMIRVIRLDATDLNVLASPNEEGEIAALLAGDEAFEGYWRRPDANVRALRDGWYLTGDTGYLDSDGDLFVTASPNAEGEIAALLAGDEAFEGYWRRPAANARALRDGWYLTGDTGYLDSDGDLFVTGRVDDMIITGGENVSPVEVESCLSLHQAVSQVAVVGLPDERWGKIVTAFIQRAAPVTKAELDAHCRGSGLADFKRPRRYVFVEEVPRSPVGKLLRRKLVEGDYAPETQSP